MQRVKKRGIILFIVFIIIAAAAYCYLLYREPVYGGYFVLNDAGNEVNYGYIY